MKVHTYIQIQSLLIRYLFVIYRTFQVLYIFASILSEILQNRLFQDEQIRLAEAENALLRKKCESLEKSVESLQAANEMKEIRKASLQSELHKEMDAMAKELEKAKYVVTYTFTL